ncbi:preprotein translocase subunit SecD [Halorussus salilacus]|uniref:preprotein translocase subunit SecD n=1 Tax=Halorussus salilacus TaxID=2953750 RepID=UPI0020A1D77C|nr:preprotein translocase subunit SecD [Halorussus salilacus]USZ67421.1 preprotein translocase subunit SecD [Halorussus salilacus]
MSIRDNWRVLLLVVFLVASTFAIFAPGVGGGGEGGGADSFVAENDGPTNLQYGLELSGGTRIRAPVDGQTAYEVEVSEGERPGEVEQRVAGNVSGADAADVTARLSPNGTTVELTVGNVSQEEFGSGLEAAGYEYDRIEDGVTDETRETIVRILRDKISQAGLSGGQVQEVTTADGNNFVVIEMPNANQTEVESLVTERGQVEVVAVFPEEDNGSEYSRDPVLQQGDFNSIGQATDSPEQGPHVPLVLNDESADNFSSAMREHGFTREGVQSCRYENESTEDPGYCLYTVVDGETVYAAGMGADLARSFENGDFEQQPSFIMQTENMSEARELQIHLNAGSLPASLNMDDGTSYFLAPSLAEEFKLYSLITGIIAALAVTVAVFLRYGDPKVAAPMLVTALSEVVILLGFAAAIQLPLDLSHIAGFIAVIGTGVDDLVIIADEVMAEGEVHSSRVFRSRFRKAFWVIGAAAATTIIAMSPLAVLSLGDLQGFAIVTILGVLVGVLVTRPAYGDILRALLTSK